MEEYKVETAACAEWAIAHKAYIVEPYGDGHRKDCGPLRWDTKLPVWVVIPDVEAQPQKEEG